MRRAVRSWTSAPPRSKAAPSPRLKTLVDRWEAETDVATRFRAVNGSRPLPPRVEVALYRVCQEALTNIASHARASRVTVRLVATPEAVQLTVRDDGHGFDPSSVADDRHGIVGMRERVEMLGGSLEIGSDPGKGTRLDVTVPLEGLQGG
jgi:signal transduction histidine kinase